MRTTALAAFALASLLPSMALADIQVRNDTQLSVRVTFFNQNDLVMAIGCAVRDLAPNGSASVERPNFMVCADTMKVEFTAERLASASHPAQKLVCLVETVAWAGASVTVRSSGQTLSCAKD